MKSEIETKNDDLLKLIGKAQKVSSDSVTSIENIAQIITCLLEANCMQIRAEEQDDEDKKGIALMGQKLGNVKSEYIK